MYVLRRFRAGLLRAAAPPEVRRGAARGAPQASMFGSNKQTIVVRTDVLSSANTSVIWQAEQIK